MKQSNNNKKSRDVTAFLYERLSRDDNMDGESYSIGNQKKLLIKVAKEKGYTNLVHFFDDGISGVTMDRPGFADMIQQLEQGKAAAVFVKDLSRLSSRPGLMKLLTISLTRLRGCRKSVSSSRCCTRSAYLLRRKKYASSSASTTGRPQSGQQPSTS